MNKITSVLGALFCVLTINVCANARSLYFGVTPTSLGDSHDASVLYKKYKDLTKWLSEKIDNRIILTPYPNQCQLANALAKGRVDFALLDSGAYLHAKARDENVKQIALSLIKNPKTKGIKTFSYSYVVVDKDTKKVKSLKDLKGDSIAFSNPSSMRSFIFPALYLEQQGVNYKTYFSQYFFKNSPRIVLKLVGEGLIGAGVVSEFDLENNPSLAKKVKPILIIRGVPNPVVAVSENMPMSMVEKMTQSLPQVPRKALKWLALEGFNTNYNHYYDPDYAAIRHNNLVPNC